VTQHRVEIQAVDGEAETGDSRFKVRGQDYHHLDQRTVTKCSVARYRFDAYAAARVKHITCGAIDGAAR
jgi:hypothetical protein